MKANQTITIVCQNEDCQRTYSVPDSQWERVKMMNIELAVCPWCHAPRDPFMFHRLDVRQCPSCGRYKYLWAFRRRLHDGWKSFSKCVTCQSHGTDKADQLI